MIKHWFFLGQREGGVKNNSCKSQRGAGRGGGQTNYSILIYQEPIYKTTDCSLYCNIVLICLFILVSITTLWSIKPNNWNFLLKWNLPGKWRNWLNSWRSSEDEKLPWKLRPSMAIQRVQLQSGYNKILFYTFTIATIWKKKYFGRVLIFDAI